MTAQEPEGNLFDQHRPPGNRGAKRVRAHTGTDVEGAPTEEGLDDADVRERLDEDPDEQKNFTEMNPDFEAEDR